MSSPRLDRLTAVAALIAVPLAVSFGGGALVVWLFADDGTFRTGTTGIAVHDWWRSPVGYPLIAAAIAALVTAVRVRRPAPALGMAAAAAVLAWVYPILAFVIFVVLGGDPGWR